MKWKDSKINFTILVITLMLLICYQYTIINHSIESRIEIIPVAAELAIDQILQSTTDCNVLTLIENGFRWEYDRWVIDNQSYIFAASTIQSALLREGLLGTEVRLIDYSWGQQLLIQSKSLWKIVTLILFIILFSDLLFTTFKVEISSSKRDMEYMYFKQFILSHRLQLMLKTMSVIILLCCLLISLHELCQIELFVPAGFLPQDSIFNFSHYQKWWALCFSSKDTSTYGQQLAVALKIAYSLSLIISCNICCLVVHIKNQLHRIGG